MFKYKYIKEGIMIKSIHGFYHICKNSYMFRLYMCILHQSVYRILSKKTVKIKCDKSCT